MKDIKISINKVNEFIELWVKFNGIYKAAMGKTSITPEEENLFLQTKSVIARKFQELADSLPIDRQTIDHTYDVVNQILSLKGISALSEPTLKKLEVDWHESYISLNRLIGHLQAQKENAAELKSASSKPAETALKTLLYAILTIMFVLIIGFLIYILK